MATRCRRRLTPAAVGRRTVNLVLQPNGRGSHFLGTTFAATTEWKVNRHLTFDAAYVHFYGGSYVHGVHGHDVNYFSTALSFLF